MSFHWHAVVNMILLLFITSLTRSGDVNEAAILVNCYFVKMRGCASMSRLKGDVPRAINTGDQTYSFCLSAQKCYISNRVCVKR